MADKKTKSKIDKIKFLEGKRIYLRPVEEEDIHQFLTWANDQEVRPLAGYQFPMTKEHVNTWREGLSKNRETQVALSIVVEKSNKFIGLIGITGIKWKDGTAESSTIIGNKSFWGKGYGTEAKMIFLDYAFNTLNLRKIWTSVFSINERSLKCQSNCGYIEEGRRKDHVFIDGNYVDEVLLAVFKEGWLSIWSKYKKKYL